MGIALGDLDEDRNISGRIKIQAFKHHIISWKFPRAVTIFFFLCCINKVNPGLGSLDIFWGFLNLIFFYVEEKSKKRERVIIQEG